MKHVLAPFDPTALEDDPATICALDRLLRITYVNRAWRDFARENGGSWGSGKWRVGVALLRAIPDALQEFYQGMFERVRESDDPIEHSYECSSPQTLRRFRMRAYRCNAGTIVVAHSLALEAPHPAAPRPASDATYRDARGVIIQCCYCRRVRRMAEAAQWDWVPEYVAQIPRMTSHGICPLCERYYFPENSAST